MGSQVLEGGRRGAGGRVYLSACALRGYMKDPKTS